MRRHHRMFDVPAAWVWVAVVSLLWPSRSLAANGSIDITGNRSGTVCQKSMGQIDSIYVVARLAGATANGITEASFRIDGLPTNWVVLGVTPNPHSAFWLGAPFTTAGALIAFNNCQPPSANGTIVLFAIAIFVPAGPHLDDVRLKISFYPFSPTTTTPLLFVCNPPDPPGFVALPALAGEFIANPLHATCAVGVSPSTWSAVKSLYWGQ